MEQINAGDRNIEISLIEGYTEKEALQGALAIIHCMMREINPTSFDLCLSLFPSLRPKDISIEKWNNLELKLISYQKKKGIQNLYPKGFFTNEK